MSKLHPTMRTRAQAVKRAHAQLSKDVPGFRALPASEQFRHTQQHATKLLRRRGR